MKERDLCELFYKEIELKRRLNVFNKKMFIFHVANEQKTHITYTMMLKRLGLTPGVADYCVLYEGGNVAFIEFKRNEKCKLTQAQESFKNICFELNIPYLVTFNIQEAINFLNKLLH